MRVVRESEIANEYLVSRLRLVNWLPGLKKEKRKANRPSVIPAKEAVLQLSIFGNNFL